MICKGLEKTNKDKTSPVRSEIFYTILSALKVPCCYKKLFQEMLSIYTFTCEGLENLASYNVAI